MTDILQTLPKLGDKKEFSLYNGGLIEYARKSCTCTLIEMDEKKCGRCGYIGKNWWHGYASARDGANNPRILIITACPQCNLRYEKGI